MSFIHQSIHRYGYGTTDTHEPVKTREEVLKEIGQRSAAIADMLFPGATYADMARLCNSNIDFILRALGVRKTSSAEKSRVIALHFMAHILGQRETLYDIERECWILLQLTHDPRVGLARVPPAMSNASGPGRGWAAQQAGVVGYERMARVNRLKRQQQVAKAVKERKPIPRDAMTPVLMPFRALKMLGLEESNINRFTHAFDVTSENEAKRNAEKTVETREAIAKAFGASREKGRKVQLEKAAARRAAAGPQEPKRPRGRPRKHPVAA